MIHSSWDDPLPSARSASHSRHEGKDVLELTACHHLVAQSVDSELTTAQE